jgi:hypothetical protein
MTTKEELQKFMRAQLTLISIFNSFESKENENASEEKTMKMLEPMMAKVIDFSFQSAFSGQEVSEEEMANLFDFDKVTKEIESDREKSLNMLQEYCSNTSKDNLIALAKVCKAVIELNGKVTAEEQETFDEFCKEYKITAEELEKKDDDELFNSFVESLNEEKK